MKRLLSSPRTWITLCFGVCCLCFLYALLIEPYWMEVVPITIKNNNIPVSFSGTRIIFLTDFHFGSLFSQERLKTIVQQVNDLQPDLILLGGDYVDREEKDILPCFTILKDLKAPLGIYGVLGNHDYVANEDLITLFFKKNKFTLLNNTSLWLKKNNEQIKLGGISDIWEDFPDLTPTSQDVQKEDFVLLLSHNPDITEQLQDSKIDLILSGHTHGGQVTLFGLFAPIVGSSFGQKYRTGIIHSPYTTTIVSNGVGNTLLPIRFFARPQIYLITLEHT